MKKILSVLLICILAFNLTSCKSEDVNVTFYSSSETEAAKENSGIIHIGIVTGSVSQSEDDRRGAEAFESKYGADIVKLAIYPNNFATEIDASIQSIVKLADDEDMKAIIVNQAIPGTTEAFRRIKEKRPDILCIASESHENLSEIGSVADLVCNSDFVSRGYLIIRTAYETMKRRVAIMEEACKEFGMNFYLETALDPTSEVGITDAKKFILDKVPEWVEKYGKNSAYFCTNDALTEPLIKQLIEYGGYFIEADLPSPLMGYPGALGLDLTNENGNFEKILDKVESTLLDIDDIAKAYIEFTPKAAWNGSQYIDANTGERLANVFNVYQDTYIMGNPGKYMGTTEIKVPEKYFYIK